MKQILFRYIMRKMEASDAESETTVLLQLALAPACAALCLLHVAILCVTPETRGAATTAYHLASSAACAACFALLRCRKYALCGLALCCDAAVYATFAVVRFGLETHALLYLLVIIVAQVLIPYAPLRARRGAGIACVAVLAFCVAWGLRHEPLSHRGPNSEAVLSLNLLLCFAGIIGELFLTSAFERLRQDQIKTLETRAYTDALTGLYNRRYADRFFRELAIRRPSRDCIAMVDIDDFKQINDRHGHPMGDAVLKDIAGVFTRSLRWDDTVIRWGGEEFLLVLHDVELVVAKRVLDKLRAPIAERQVSAGADETVSYTITAGIAPLNAANCYQSVAECDRKLYVGKRNGKNRIEI